MPRGNKNDDKEPQDAPEANDDPQDDPDTQDAPDTEDLNAPSPDPDAAEKLAEKVKERGPIDPVTNQPLSDFFPNTEGDDERSQVVAVTGQALSVASGNARFRNAENSLAAYDAENERIESARERVETVNEETKRIMENVTVVPVELYRARERARIVAEARASGANRTVPGGRFFVDGNWVNANGDRVAPPPSE